MSKEQEPDLTTDVNLPLLIHVDGVLVYTAEDEPVVTLGFTPDHRIIINSAINVKESIIVQVDVERATEAGAGSDLLVLGMWIGAVGVQFDDDEKRNISLVPEILSEDADEVQRIIESFSNHCQNCGNCCEEDEEDERDCSCGDEECDCKEKQSDGFGFDFE